MVKKDAAVPATLEDALRRIKRLERDVRKAQRERDELVMALEAAERDLSQRVGETIAEAHAVERPASKTWYGHATLTRRAQAAYARTNSIEGEKSWSEFVESAIVREMLRLEDRYNWGEAFKEVPHAVRPGVSPVNRSWGSKPRATKSTTATDAQ